jgi:hypothetical protein
MILILRQKEANESHHEERRKKKGKKKTREKGEGQQELQQRYQLIKEHPAETTRQPAAACNVTNP